MGYGRSMIYGSGRGGSDAEAKEGTVVVWGTIGRVAILQVEQSVKKIKD